jgi:hypothetical protein
VIAKGAQHGGHPTTSVSYARWPPEHARASPLRLRAVCGRATSSVCESAQARNRCGSAWLYDLPDLGSVARVIERLHLRDYAGRKARQPPAPARERGVTVFGLGRLVPVVRSGALQRDGRIGRGGARDLELYPRRPHVAGRRGRYFRMVAAGRSHGVARSSGLMLLPGCPVDRLASFLSRCWSVGNFTRLESRKNFSPMCIPLVRDFPPASVYHLTARALGAGRESGEPDVRRMCP